MAAHLSFWGQRADGVPCIGQLQCAFQGRPRSYPGWTPISKTFQHTGRCYRKGVVCPTPTGKDHNTEYLTELMRSFFVIFYVDDAYFASRDPVFLQTALVIVVELFKRVGLETNRLKT